MELPERIDARWIKTLPDADLVEVEWRLHKLFSQLDDEERQRRGSGYELLRGPEPLVSAWLRWSMVNTATRSRGLHPRYRRHA
jgi:hypothetical protein